MTGSNQTSPASPHSCGLKHNMIAAVRDFVRRANLVNLSIRFVSDGWSQTRQSRQMPSPTVRPKVTPSRRHSRASRSGREAL